MALESITAAIREQSEDKSCKLGYDKARSTVKENQQQPEPYNSSNDITRVTKANKNLSDAVAQHFADNKHSRKLIYLLDHSYTKPCLKWSSMKDSDKTSAFALLTVAKAQGLTPCLGLIDYEEQWEMCPRRLKNHLYHLAHLIDENNIEYPQEEVLLLYGKYSNSFQHYHFKNKSVLNYVEDEEVCYTVETRERFSCRSITKEGWGPDENITEDLWYRRSCVVLFME